MYLLLKPKEKKLAKQETRPSAMFVNWALQKRQEKKNFPTKIESKSLSHSSKLNGHHFQDFFQN